MTKSVTGGENVPYTLHGVESDSLRKVEFSVLVSVHSFNVSFFVSPFLVFRCPRNVE